jgi:chromate transporter
MIQDLTGNSWRGGCGIVTIIGFRQSEVFMTETPPSTPYVSYAELARFFLRFSLTAFGGPVAHLALGEEQIVTRRKWLTREHYLDLIAATNLIPGPNSTEVMIHVGYILRGIPGAVVAGLCFILPAFVLVLALSVLYVSTGGIPQVESILWGIKPVIVAIIANVGYRLIRTALNTRALWVLFIAALVAIVLLNVHEVIVMLAAGVIYGLYQSRGRILGAQNVLPIFFAQPLLQAIQSAPVSVFDIFLYFLKIGSILFGSGYVLFAYIQQDVVNGFGWVTSQQLLDAIAIGQITPGPVSTTTAVIGYIIAGLPGAVAATLGIFLPSFVLVILTAPLIPKMRQNAFLGGFLSGVNAGVIAAILVTLADLASASIRTVDGAALSPVAIVVGLGALALLLRTKINPTWLILAGGIIGLVAGLM